MRLIDADKLFPDVMTKREALAISQGQLAYAPTVEAIPKPDYEARLKADKIAMLEELKKEIEENGIVDFEETYVDDGECIISVSECNRLIQEKINALKGDK